MKPRPFTLLVTSEGFILINLTTVNSHLLEHPSVLAL